jgi:8-oxo-dGTP diphosphatase
MLLTEENKHEFFDVALSSSLVLFGFDGEKLKILIRKRANEPYKGALILPSIYILPNESIEVNLQKLIEEKIGLTDCFLEQLQGFTKVFRNPIGRVINIAFYAVVMLDDRILKLNEQEGNIWVNASDVGELAFDHNEIVKYAKEKLKRRVKRRPIGFNLLPDEFTILQLQSLYEEALGKDLDKRNFRKKLFKSKLVYDTGKFFRSIGSKKPSKLYSFDRIMYDKMTLKGYDILF